MGYCLVNRIFVQNYEIILQIVQQYIEYIYIVSLLDPDSIIFSLKILPKVVCVEQTCFLALFL